ncbi:MAG: hypothetical protein ABEJ98_01145 [Candidatus Nanohaloarchaea archaeon]
MAATGQGSWDEDSTEVIKDTLDFSETTVSQVEEVLGMSVEVFDDAVKVEDEEVPGRVVNQMGWLSSDDKMVLQYSDELSPSDLAYLAVKGQIKRFDFRDFGKMFPVPDRFSKRLYTEFVANLARFDVNNYFAEEEKDKISANSFLSAGARYDLLDARDEYMEKRKEAADHGMPSNDILELKNSGEYQGSQLWLEYDISKETVVDKEVLREFQSSIKNYLNAIEGCAAPIAAKKYHHIEEDYEISEFIVPSEQLFHDTIDYMDSVIADFENKRQLNRSRNS